MSLFSVSEGVKVNIPALISSILHGAISLPVKPLRIVDLPELVVPTVAMVIIGFFNRDKVSSDSLRNSLKHVLSRLSYLISLKYVS